MTSTVKKGKKPTETKDNVPSFDVYLHKLMEEHHSGLQINKQAVEWLNRFILNVLAETGRQCVLLAEHGRHKGVTSRDVQTMVRISYESQLARSCIASGTKAVTKFVSSKVPKKEKERNKSSARVSTTKRSGLVLNVARVSKVLRATMSSMRNDVRIGRGAPIYLAAVVEDLVVRMLTEAATLVASEKVKRIQPKHLEHAAQSDKALQVTLTRLGLHVVS